eukprot:scaffold31129_cov59-Phaeocystis_antarctica.AAC.3
MVLQNRRPCGRTKPGPGRLFKHRTGHQNCCPRSPTCRRRRYTHSLSPSRPSLSSACASSYLAASPALPCRRRSRAARCALARQRALGSGRIRAPPARLALVATTIVFKFSAMGAWS